MPFLNYNEQIAICAQQENPFVTNKPYNPDEVFFWVVMHLLGGESPLTSEEVDHAKTVYTATIETLLGQDLAVTEANIIQQKDAILGYLPTLLAENMEPAEADRRPGAGTGIQATVDNSVPGNEDDQKSVGSSEEYFECNGIRVKKTWVKVAAILVLIFLFFKLIK